MDIKKDWQNVILIPVFIWITFYFADSEKLQEMSAMIGLGIVCLFFANLHRFRKFKGGGIEAELQRVVEEANATIENLRELSEPLILSALDNLTYAGRWGGMAPIKKHELKSKIDEVVEKFDINNDTITNAQSNFHYMTAIDHINYIASRFHSKKITNIEVRDNLRALFNPEGISPPTMDDLMRVISGLEQEEIAAIQPYIDDYEYYLGHNAMRRPEALRDD